MRSSTELSRREREVAGLVAEGLTNRQIAERLFIAERTAEGHVEQIRNKLGFNSRSQIAAWVAERRHDPVGRPEFGSGHSNLPEPTGDLIGREDEIGELAEIVAQRRGVLTLTGPGGVGKSRLALAAAARLRDRFPDGVWFVDLAPLRDPEHVPGSIARVLGLQPRGDRSAVNSIAAALARRSTLLVVDNFEHLVAAAAILGKILANSPESAILVTSREALRLYGEQEYPVTSLSIGDEVHPGPAIQLFIARAREIAPARDFVSNLAAIKSLCEKLDGLPLAIELAAARARVLSPAATLERLEQSIDVLRMGARNVATRHQALTAAFDWSFDLLTEPEKVLFQRFGIFRGGFSLAAAEAVCVGSEIGARDVVDLIDSLAAKSLVRRDDSTPDPRFHMLETIRDFAHSKLESSQEANSVRQRHMLYFRDLAEREVPNMTTTRQLMTLARFDSELPNFRSAIECSRETEDVEMELRLLGSLWLYWLLRGQTEEGLEWLSRAPLEDTRSKPELRAEALVGLVNLYMTSGNRADAARVGRELLGLAPSCPRPGRYMGWGYLGQLLEAFHDQERMGELVENGTRFMAESGSPFELSFAYTVRGEYEREYGTLGAARTAYEKALAVLEKAGERFQAAINHHNLGQIALLLGDLQTAKVQFTKTFEAGRSFGATKLLASALIGLANVEHAEGRHLGAAQLLGCADAAFARAGYVIDPADEGLKKRLETELRESLGESSYEELHSAGEHIEPMEIAFVGGVFDAAIVATNAPFGP